MSEGLPAGELDTERWLIINEVAGTEIGSSTAPRTCKRPRWARLPMYAPQSRGTLTVDNSKSKDFAARSIASLSRELSATWAPSSMASCCLASVEVNAVTWHPHARANLMATPPGARSLEVGKTDLALLDAFARYLALADEPIAARVLAPRVLDEIHFRLLLAPHGAMLHQLIAHDSHARGVGRAIEHIRREFKQSLAMSDLAKLAGMSTSSFYRHFSSIAATSPLQYQKDLRLLEARRLLRTERYTVSGAAYEVGYESLTQFSREYARKFGQPPRAEIATA